MNSDSLRDSHNETIHLTLPTNPSYVSAARLTASSIANRMGFDSDEIEDVKAAVSEACTFIIKKVANGTFTVNFNIGSEFLNIELYTSSGLSLVIGDDEMGLLMIKALMDSLKIENMDDDHTVIAMTKKHKKISFE